VPRFAPQPLFVQGGQLYWAFPFSKTSLAHPFNICSRLHRCATHAVLKIIKKVFVLFKAWKEQCLQAAVFKTWPSFEQKGCELWHWEIESTMALLGFGLGLSSLVKNQIQSLNHRNLTESEGSVQFTFLYSN